MSSEVYSYLYEKVLKEGALDIYTQSIYMKKNRPAVKLSVICRQEDLDKFIEIILIETSTFGIRYNKYNREILNRRFEILNTSYGKITVKLGYYNGNLIKVTPEYEDCRKICEENNIPLNILLYKLNHIINKEFNIKLLT